MRVFLPAEKSADLACACISLVAILSGRDKPGPLCKFLLIAYYYLKLSTLVFQQDYVEFIRACYVDLLQRTLRPLTSMITCP
jgi:hypothetical protein